MLYCRLDGITVNIEDLYRKLQASDLPKLWIPSRDHFFEVSALPYLGTGKLDLTAVKALASAKCRASKNPERDFGVQ